MKKIVLFVFISIILICIGCDLSFLQKIDTLQKTSSQTEQTADNAQQDTTQPEQGTNNPQPGQDTGNSQTGGDTDNSQSGTSQPGQVPDNPETGENTDDSQSGTSQPEQVPDNPETGEDVDNPQQDQNETTVESQNSIDFFYSINQDNNISLTPVVSWEGVDKNTLQYVWVTSDAPSITEENPTITVGEGGTSTSVTLYVFNGTPSQETEIGRISKTISLTGTFPTNTTPGSGLKKLFLFAEDKNHPEKNSQYMYFALRIEGTSPHGTFRTEATKDGLFTYAYPRSVQYEHKSSDQDRYTSMYAQATPNLSSLGVGYNDETGFGNKAGTSFSMPFYLGDNKCRVQINGKEKLSYTFANFVVWDTVVDTFLGNWGWPVLIRCPSSAPLTITIPMDKYDSNQHKNIALLTVTFNDDAKKTDFKYDVKFDRFVNKNE